MAYIQQHNTFVSIVTLPHCASREVKEVMFVFQRLLEEAKDEGKHSIFLLVYSTTHFAIVGVLSPLL